MARIVVVDDNREMVDMLCLALKILGHDPIAAYGGEHAIEIMEKQLPDAVLLDWMMPGMDGREALRRIRAIPDVDGMPVIVLTASAAHDLEALVVAAGATGCILKPVSLDMLAKSIAHYVGLPVHAGSDGRLAEPTPAS
ncbi:MAG: response regulator [Anaerolineales bacterium]|jgi:CheY-like chemotaxis protein